MDDNHPLVSCLCVTENRPEFMPWLLWNYTKQTYPHKELIVVDSSAVPFTAPGVRTVAAPGANIPVKRNTALQAAHGGLVAWFDDDDWQHPDRLTLTVEAWKQKGGVVGVLESIFMDLYSLAYIPHKGNSLIFNTALFPVDEARRVEFEPERRVASDSAWKRGVMSTTSAHVLDNVILGFWLCHKSNISNPNTKRHFNQVGPPASRVLRKAWGDTDARLHDLRTALKIDG